MSEKIEIEINVRTTEVKVEAYGFAAGTCVRDLYKILEAVDIQEEADKDGEEDQVTLDLV